MASSPKTRASKGDEADAAIWRRANEHSIFRSLRAWRPGGSPPELPATFACKEDVLPSVFGVWRMQYSSTSTVLRVCRSATRAHRGLGRIIGERGTSAESSRVAFRMSHDWRVSY